MEIITANSNQHTKLDLEICLENGSINFNLVNDFELSSEVDGIRVLMALTHLVPQGYFSFIKSQRFFFVITLSKVLMKMPFLTQLSLTEAKKLPSNPKFNFIDFSVTIKLS